MARRSELARPDDGFLPDELVQGARAHAGGQRGFAAHAVVHGVGEEVHYLLSSRARCSKSVTFNSSAHWCR